jgi:type I restriction enzyme S subunit
MSFPRYPAHKASGVEWIGEVPSGWAVQPLRRHARLLTEKTDRRDHPVALENIESWTGRFLPTDTEFQGDGVAFERGDILFGKLRPYLAKTLVATASGEAVGDFLVMRPTEAANSRFLAYLLRSSEVISIIDGSTFGSKMPRASWDFVGAMPTPLPSPQEQQAIVSFLDRETIKIDALVEEQRRLIDLLEEKRQTVVSQTVTKGLDLAVPMKQSGVDWLGQVPAHWGISRLRYVTRPGASITYGIVQAGPHIEDGIPYIKTSDMSGQALPLEGYARTTAEIDASYARSKVAAGDLVIAIRASVGKCLPVPAQLDGANLTQGTARIAPGDLVDAEFLLAYINAQPVQTYLNSVSKGATFKEITIDTLRKTPVLLPPLAEQRAIGSQVRALTEQFQELIDGAEAAEALLLERRSALISAAVTGKIDVRSLSPQPEAVAA